MIHEFGVRAGRISLNRMVELLATNPAKLFGLYPRKGTIAVGSDADIVVFDPEKRKTITAANQHSKTDYNLYEGTEVTGSPEVVLLRGNVLVEGDELVASPGIGQYVARAKFGEERRRERRAVEHALRRGALDGRYCSTTSRRSRSPRASPLRFRVDRPRARSRRALPGLARATCGSVREHGAVARVSSDLRSAAAHRVARMSRRARGRAEEPREAARVRRLRDLPCRARVQLSRAASRSARGEALGLRRTAAPRRDALA